MKEYCFDCLQIFDESELESCNYCTKCSFHPKDKKIDRIIITKSGVKKILLTKLFCKNCLQLKHQHKGEAWL